MAVKIIDIHSDNTISFCRFNSGAVDYTEKWRYIQTYKIIGKLWLFKYLIKVKYYIIIIIILN